MFLFQDVLTPLANIGHGTPSGLILIAIVVLALIIAASWGTDKKS